MISVVIPAHNEENNIGACLESLAAQKTRHRFEVIVVDDDSSDRTADIARSFRHRLPLRVISIRGRRRGKARYAGCREARGEYIFGTDADTRLRNDWIGKGMDALQMPGVIAVTGSYHYYDFDPFRKLLFALWLPLWIRASRLAFGHYLLRGSNFAVRRSAYLKAGQFDPDADAHEDTDLSFRLAPYGIIAYSPCFHIATTGRRFEQGLLRGSMEYATGFFRRFVLGERYVRFSVAK